MRTVNFLSQLQISLLLISLLGSCNKQDDTSFQTITGYVQKGPFINGSSVTVYDLKSDL